MTIQPEVELVEVYGVYEARAGERQENHYHVADFFDNDYALSFIDAISSTPVQHGALYYIVPRLEPHTPTTTGETNGK